MEQLIKIRYDLLKYKMYKKWIKSWLFITIRIDFIFEK